MDRIAMYGEKSEVAQDVLDTLLLSDLVKMVENSSVREPIGFEQSTLGIRPMAINDLRGSVAHYQLLIHTVDTMSWTKQRTTGDFGDIYDAPNNCLKTLEKQNYV